MKSLPAPQDLMKKLSKDKLFKDWQKQHLKNYLSHLFCLVSSELKAKTNWEIGFFDEETAKITVFAAPSNENFEIKPADDVFKKPTEKIEVLQLDKIKNNVDDATEKFKKVFPEYFPNEQMGDGFLILQTIDDKTFWNFSFISKSLKFLNIKISVEDGSVISHDVIELVQK